MKAKIISTYRLGKDQIEEIRKKIPLIKEAEIENEVDKKILGGIVIEVEGKIIDLSILGKLKTFKKNLYEAI